MNILKAILFGIVEGITEWMPVSSSAHLKLLSIFLPLDLTPEFYNVFESMIRLGAVLALFLVFWNKIWFLGSSKNLTGEGALTAIKKDKVLLWLKIIAACIPAILLELLPDDLFRFVNEKNEMIIMGTVFILAGIIFVVVEMMLKRRSFAVVSTRQITFLQAMIIGLAQLITVILPGTSRLGLTIAAALLLGICRPAATEFAYELAIPVVLGECIIKVLKFTGAVSFYGIATLLVGCAFAFAVSLFMIRYVLNYIRRNTFMIFGVYRVLMGIVILVFLR